MTPAHLRVHNLGVLRDVDLDLRALPEGIIALVGPNGAGKSTFLDAIGFAPLYRAWSSKPGELRDYCPGPARLDLDVEMGGRTYALRLRIDPHAKGGAGQTDATITRDGEPLTAGTRTTDYDLAVCDWPATRDKPATKGVFPSRRLLLASAFGAQDRSGGFAALDPAERKALFGELLGTEEHQERSVRAREKGAALDADLAAIARDLAALDATRARRVELLANIAEAERLHLDAARDEAIAEAALEEAGRSALAARAALDAAVRDDQARATRAAELGRDLTTVDAELLRAGAALRDLATLTERAEDIRSRAVRLTEAQSALTTCRASYSAAVAATSAASAAETRERATLARLRADLPKLEQAAERLHADRLELPAVTERAARAEELRAAHETASRELEALLSREREADARLEAAIRAHERAEDLVRVAAKRAELLAGVPCGGGRVLVFGCEADEEVGDGTRADCSSCRFLTDATEAHASLPELRAAAARAEEGIGPLAEEHGRLMGARIAQGRVVGSLTAERTAYSTASTALEVLRTRTTANARADEELAEMRERIAAAGLEVLRHSQDHANALAAAEQAEAAGRAAKALVGQLEGADVDLRRLDVALGSAAHVRAAHATAEGRRAAILDALASLPAAPDLAGLRRAAEVLAPAEQAARATHRAAVTATRAAAGRLDHARGALDALGDLDARAEEMIASRSRLALRRAGFAELERAFGRDGIQALEIDAAGPEVSRITNELLAVAVGGRFAVSLVTLQEASGNRKQREVFDLRVRDAQREHDGVAFDRLSMGEQALVGEALKLAITVHNARRSGRELRTLFRDEGDRDLDAERRAAYPAILRRAMELGGFTRCYLISHDPVVYRQADAVIRIEEGRAWVE